MSYSLLKLNSRTYRQIHVCNHGSPTVHQKFKPARGHLVSGLEWGINRTSNLLFVTWQPKGQRGYINGYNHQSLDIHDGSLVHNFSSSTHPGSALGLSPNGKLFLQLFQIILILSIGSRIALATHTETSHILSIFDVRVKESEPIAEHIIPGILPGGDIEHLKFDPSGEYLAVGQSDNVVQIFDTRVGTILHTLHHGKSISTKPPDEHYGITAMEWITGWHGCGMRLLTGGEDGEWLTPDCTPPLN